MRLMLSAVVAASLLGSHLAAAAESCARPAERTAFDVAGLKTQLMVTALTCHADEKYNTFITRFRPDLQSSEKALNAYFQRTFGRRGQSQHDDYVTQLANSQSQTGLKKGSNFCDETISLFDEVAALRTASELPDFASGHTLVQPVNYSTCTTPDRPVRVIRASSTTRHHRK